SSRSFPCKGVTSDRPPTAGGMRSPTVWRAPRGTPQRSCGWGSEGTGGWGVRPCECHARRNPIKRLSVWPRKRRRRGDEAAGFGPPILPLLRSGAHPSPSRGRISALGRSLFSGGLGRRGRGGFSLGASRGFGFQAILLALGALGGALLGLLARLGLLRVVA